MIIQNIYRLSALTLISLSLLSCATKMYPGPSVSKERLSFITGSGIPLYKGVQIRDYDGEGNYFIGRRVEVIAGEITINIEYYDITKAPTYSVQRSITLTVEPSRTYTVFAEEDGDSLKVWVEDASSGDVTPVH